MIEVNRSENGQYYLNVKSRNGAVLATTETYTKRPSVFRVIAALIKAVCDGIIIDKTRKHGNGKK